MPELTDNLQEPAADLSMGTARLPGRDVLGRDRLRALNVRSDCQGLRRFAGHLLTIVATGSLVHFARGELVLLLPAMLVHGFAIATLFAPMHECVHMTAFQSRWLNKIVGWIAGAASFYNSDYYRYYHQWHHRFTQDPAHDPELMTPKPRTLAAYGLRLSGLLFWRDKLRDLLMVSAGRLAHLPYVPAQARRRVAWAMRAQLGLYALVAVAAVWLGSTVPLIYWLFPVMLGQPLLRAILLAEHTGCSEDANGLTNTRTTLTSWPVRLLMWNMPYHAEHHLYPSIPFHALPRAHADLRARLAHVAPGYRAVHRGIIRRLRQVSSATA
jgi:fatty acid desaturase